MCFIERQLKLKHRSHLHGEVLFQLDTEHGRTVDRQSKLLAVGPIMIISKRDHYVKLSNHINIHGIKRESVSYWFELDKILNFDDVPIHTDISAVRIKGLWKLIVFIPVEANIIIY